MSACLVRFFLYVLFLANLISAVVFGRFRGGLRPPPPSPAGLVCQKAYFPLAIFARARFFPKSEQLTTRPQNPPKNRKIDHIIMYHPFLPQFSALTFDVKIYKI
jgi:hypothetical protein